MLMTHILAFTILFIAMTVCIVKRKLTTAGGVAGFMIGSVIYLSLGYTGLFMLATFFLLATIATSHKAQLKQHIDPAAEEHSGRTAGQVIANGGVAAVAALIGVIMPEHNFLIGVLVAAALSAATSDTLSSELGMVYGKRCYNILTFKKDTRGLNGVISLEGLLSGILGACCVAAVYSLGFGFTLGNFVIIVLAGTVGNLVDSLLGATLERKAVLNNDAVNTLNTLAACLFSLLLL